MRKIIDYKIVTSWSDESLSEKVCDILKEGWQPYGNIVEIRKNCREDETILRQAMVKYEEE